MVEEGPSEEVTAQAAMTRPEGLEWNGKGEREEAGESICAGPPRGSGGLALGYRETPAVF